MPQRKTITVTLRSLDSSPKNPHNFLPSQLLKYFESLEKMLVGMGVDTDAYGDEAFISVSEFTQGSTVARLPTFEDVAHKNDEVWEDVAETGGENLPVRVNSELRKLVEYAREDNVIFLVSREDSEDAWELTPETVIKDPRRVANCRTSISGTFVRVDKKNRTVSLQVLKHQVTLVELTNEQLQQFMLDAGAELDQRFRVRGLGMWDVRADRLVSMKPESITSVKRPDSNFWTRFKELSGDIDLDDVDADQNMLG